MAAHALRKEILHAARNKSETASGRRGHVGRDGERGVKETTSATGKEGRGDEGDARREGQAHTDRGQFSDLGKRVF